MREAAAVETDAWIGEYPFLDRRAMPQISARIARDARARREWKAQRKRDEKRFSDDDDERDARAIDARAANGTSGSRRYGRRALSV